MRAWLQLNKNIQQCTYVQTFCAHEMLILSMVGDHVCNLCDIQGSTLYVLAEENSLID